jgi:Protein of unknown function (DUF2793)
MTETTRLGLPLVQAAQAQKHVTVNEAFGRLDALAQMTLSEIGATTPPVSPTEGDVIAIGAGAGGEWAGRDGDLGVFLNNGWEYIVPRVGWRGWSEAAGSSVVFDGVEWVEGAGALSANGAGFVHRTSEVDHAVGSGPTSVIGAAIPGDAVVYGVTARVLGSIGGASSLEIGVTSSSNRYGSGIGTAAGAWARGLTGSPLAYYSATDLVLTATGGDFDGTGVLRVAVHFAELTLPRA